MRTVTIQQHDIDKMLNVYPMIFNSGAEGNIDVIVTLTKEELIKLREEIDKHLNRS